MTRAFGHLLACDEQMDAEMAYPKISSYLHVSFNRPRFKDKDVQYFKELQSLPV
ncbi:hypothetical protein EKH55_4101 [Sinorhizobium alkalisoli]|nr:hypothetical protein EKH55_4101 [Sinorhizobium alkalisoli]